MMSFAEDIDQFELLEKKVDAFIARIGELGRDNGALREKVRSQEEIIAGLNAQVEGLTAAREKARQRVLILLEKIDELAV